MKVGPREASLPSGQVAEPSVNLAPRRFVLGNPRSQLKCTTRADPAIQRARFGSSHPAILAPHETAADTRRPGGVPPVLVAAQGRLVVHELLPGDVGWVDALQADRPLLQRPRVDLGLAVGRRAVERVVLLLPVGVRPGVGRVVQQADQVEQVRGLPAHLAVAGAAPDLRGNLQLLARQLHQDPAGDLVAGEQAEGVVRRACTWRSGSLTPRPSSERT